MFCSVGWRSHGNVVYDKRHVHQANVDNRKLTSHIQHQTRSVHWAVKCTAHVQLIAVKIGMRDEVEQDVHKVTHGSGRVVNPQPTSIE